MSQYQACEGFSAMSEAVDVRGGTVEDGLANGRRLLGENPEVALDQARHLLKLGPDPRVLRLAAAAHRSLGQATEAEAAELAAIQQSIPLPQFKACAKAEHEGRSAEASAIAAEQLRREPDDLLAMTMSAESAVALRRLPEGEKLIRRVLQRVPTFLRATMILARSLMLQARIQEAVAVMRDAADRVPANLHVNLLLGQLQAEARDFEGAASTYERLLGPHDRDLSLWISYGDMLRFMGRKTDAELAYRRAIAVDPQSGPAWWGLANLDPACVSDADLRRMRGALEARSDRPEDSGALHFALGAVLDRRGEHEQAFEHLAQGNRMREQAQPDDPARISRSVDASIALFTKKFYAARSDAGSADDSPIFIVGMPRSGSTLVERILGAHSEIEAAGELPVIPRLVETLSYRGGGVGKYRDLIAKMDSSEIAALADHYLERSAEYRHTDRARFTDKLHMNWRHVGFIHLILPNARIIDVRRGAMDCCWSNFKLLFTRGHPAASNLGNIGRFYADYVRMLDHMDAAAPGAVLRVNYESVVDDLEGETRRILDFLGLPFDQACIDFHTSRQPVATASSEQVRKPLNRDGIGVAAPYARWLGPLREALGPLADV
jgi:tetratricopeptide (TPR) repeat protein